MAPGRGVSLYFTILSSVMPIVLNMKCLPSCYSTQNSLNISCAIFRNSVLLPVDCERVPSILVRMALAGHQGTTRSSEDQNRGQLLPYTTFSTNLIASWLRP